MSTPSRTDGPTSAAPFSPVRAPAGLQIPRPATDPAWRTAFDLRRALVAALLAPITVILLLDAPAAGSIDHPAEWTALVLLGLLTAATWATFVPRRDGARSGAAGPCGAMAGLYPVLALMMLGGNPLTPWPALVAVLFLGWGLAQRMTGAGACST